MSSNFVMPKQIISGAGALNNAKDVFKKAGKKALIVSGKVMEEVGNVARADSAASSRGSRDGREV